MKRGGYDLGNYIIYFIVAMIILAAPILTIKSYTSRGVYDSIKEQHQIQEYLLSRYVVDCLAPRDAAKRVALGTIALSQFTEERLKSCTSEPVSVTLEQSGNLGINTIVTDPSLKQYTSLKTIRQEYVLVDGKRSLLTVGVKDA